jgi:hypothetical protein
MRVVLTLMCFLYAAIAGLDIELHHPVLAAIMAFMALGLAATATYATYVLRKRRAELRRPDYAQIASMERALFGRTFDHAR